MNLIALVGILGAGLGYAIRSIWDSYLKRSFERDAKRLELLERKLSEFYWPVFLRLQKDNAVWERIVDRDSDDELRRQVGHEIERSVILPNHDEIVRIIEDRIHVAAPNVELTDELLKYMRHVAVYKALRASGVEDHDPISLGEPWPDSLFPLIEQRTRELQSAYDADLRLFSQRLRR